jgi:hypothetical protein
MLADSLWLQAQVSDGGRQSGRTLQAGGHLASGMTLPNQAISEIKAAPLRGTAPGAPTPSQPWRPR